MNSISELQVDAPSTLKAPTEQKLDLPSGLMMLRNAYLQCIASCWADENQKTGFVSQSGKPAINALESPLFQSFIHVVDLQEGERFGAVYQPFNPNAINGWLGASDIMVVKIPKAPQQNQRTKALSNYYNLFNTHLGNSIVGAHDSVSKEKVIDQEMVDLFQLVSKNYSSEEIIEVLSNNITSNLGVGGADQFLSFGAIVMSIIARCWEDEDYLKHITNTLISPLGTQKSLYKDEFVTFQNPWIFNIKFELAEEGNSTWNGEKWEAIENNEIYLLFPQKPSNRASHAMALSRYNNTGPAYPFTCT